MVSGVTGFLGGRVASELARAGHQVVGFCRDASRWSGRPALAEVVTGDVTDRAAVERAVEGCDAAIHAAALVKTSSTLRRETSMRVRSTQTMVGPPNNE